MADDLTLASGNATGFPAGETFATDNILNRHFQEVKVALGAHGTDDGDLEGTKNVILLTSSARTATADSADQSAISHRGAIFLLNVTVSGGMSDTLSLAVQAKDPISGSYVDLYDFGVVITGTATGLIAAILYPDVSAADIDSGFAKVGNLPRDWRAEVTPSDATSWTYSLAASLLI